MVFQAAQLNQNDILWIKDELTSLIKGEENLYCSTTEDFLIRFIRAGQYDPKNAFRLVREYFLAKKDMPEAFIPKSPSKYLNLISRVDLGFILPKPDDCSRRVICFNMGNMDPDKEDWDDIVNACIIVLEALSLQQDVQDHGLSVIFNCDDFSIKLMRWLTPSNIRIVLRVVHEAFPIKFEAFHICNAPFAFNIFYASLKLFLPKEIQKKINWHTCRPFKELIKTVGQDNLPSYLGGSMTQEKISNWYHFVPPYETKLAEFATMGYNKDILKR